MSASEKTRPEWLNRRDWQAGNVRGGAFPGSQFGGLIFAAATVVPAILFMVFAVAEDRSGENWVALAGPVGGGLLLAAIVYGFVRVHRRVGPMTLRLERLPLEPGGDLIGSIEMRSVPSSYRFNLAVVEEGKLRHRAKRRTDPNYGVLYSAELGGEISMHRNGSGVSFQLNATLPENLPTIDQPAVGWGVTWRLWLNVEEPFETSVLFELPVVAASGESQPEAASEPSLVDQFS